ncbi:MAG: type II toxin-antitoxin system RelE/ParE family toxin [Candidatus Brocadia sp. AMX2]|uniref:Type II toxin-antitoxin system RelE/ParE family toxin n=1 Tax=Candidatus Brocadia sinica JPN1 TaxID=1197129 RepID=A0ABQ0JX45_9BACT|nr:MULTISPECIES: type II toxin-antitoxin system RelE/ParE family toxin [Brocadia]MBC6931034.1 type II toxin-antitoxin system RelE/ParE family toxin [Candidatus Brocadia sp.]MBL1168189.1 type II toxin-antitoxin system RelE/ParE family toxin [Candidatus Brocadia sp. AMX1]NOG40963.1 type II toxin-antitoxin system RelE/ParE family toxin [Planctomycetota bacterium]GIK13070.1 MAG: toxin, RelE family protein [Candidatus Brocadia sinica]KAA0244299.1 MAG: type II toxin-antitoxin system RelE/ParE family
MKYKIIIRPEAEDDLKEAFVWYEGKRKGLGYDFLLQIDAALRFIEENPTIHPIVFKGTRKHLIRRFPYKAIYLVERENIVVLAVIHGKRNPKLIQHRIENI